MSALAFPIMLTDLHAVRCLVVGGGQVAERKVEALLEAGARVVVISPSLTPLLTQRASDGRVEHINRAYRDGDLASAFLAIAATDSRDVNLKVADAARHAGILINVADDPAAGNFHTAATIRRGELLLAISTGGASPAVSALLRRKLEAILGEEYAALLALMRVLRPRVRDQVAAPWRPAIWRALASDEVLAWLRAGDMDRVELYAKELIARARSGAEQPDTQVTGNREQGTGASAASPVTCSL
jgi:precorrin-2 dehydrogenase / sirohydrochlorin ferrochelatase